jgi:hypothetical protein
LEVSAKVSVIIGLLFFLALIAAIVFGIRFLTRRRDHEASGDLDLIAYGLLAIAVGTSAFALVALAGAAFPDQTIVGGGSEQTATALAGLVVAVPIAVVLWRRQALRRRQHPDTVGWPIYLAVMEAVFMTATVISGFNVVFSLLGTGNATPWTDLIIFGGVVALHEVARLRTPTGSDAAGLPRVMGSAIGLIPTAIGVTILLYGLFNEIYGSIAATVTDFDLAVALSFLIVGAPVWYFRWWRPWPLEPGGPRKVWLVITSVSGLLTALGAAVAIAISGVTFLAGDTRPAAEHFEFVPVSLAILIVALGIWLVHQRDLSPERGNTLRSYEYIITAFALGSTIASATSLAAIAFGEFDLVGPGDTSLPWGIAIVIVVSLAVWWWFWSKVQTAPREVEAKATPRRVYLLGMGVITGLTAAEALIATLVVVFQQLLDAGGSTNALAVQAPLFVFSGLAMWHLLRVNAQDKKLFEAEEVIAPFQVTVICSHPGQLATVLPKQANLRILYRADEVGIIDDEMAEDIAAAIGQASSLVWVGAGDFEVATARFD